MLEMPSLIPVGFTHTKRVAFMGPMCSGKTFCAQHLVNEFGFIKIGFADKLKSLVYDLYGINGKDGYSRQVLQELADDLKKYDKDLFIKHLLFRVKKHEYESIVVDDLRFKVEANILRKNGFTIIKVICGDAIRQERIARLYPTVPQGAQEHRSEHEWTEIRYDKFVVSENINAIFDLDKILDLI